MIIMQVEQDHLRPKLEVFIILQYILLCNISERSIKRTGIQNKSLLKIHIRIKLTDYIFQSVLICEMGKKKLITQKRLNLHKRFLESSS